MNLTGRLITAYQVQLNGDVRIQVSEQSGAGASGRRLRACFIRCQQMAALELC